MEINKFADLTDEEFISKYQAVALFNGFEGVKYSFELRENNKGGINGIQKS